MAGVGMVCASAHRAFPPRGADPPRQCGLAAYASELRRALGGAAPAWRIDVCALDRDGLAYGPEVGTVLAQSDPADYARAADAIADAGTDLVLIEHEYGIFGGP